MPQYTCSRSQCWKCLVEIKNTYKQTSENAKPEG